MFLSLWESKFWRIFLWTLLAVVLLLSASLGVVFWKYQTVSRSNLVTEQIAPLGFVTEAPYRLGQTVLLSAEFRAPWNQHPGAVEVQPGEGTQLLSEPLWSTVGYGWGDRRWMLTFEIQPFADGAIPEGKVLVTFSGADQGRQDFNLVIPAMEVSPVEGLEVEAPLFAGRVDVNRPVSRWWVAGVIAVCALLVLAGILLSRKKAQESASLMSLTPWQSASKAIHDLRDGVQRGVLSPEVSIGSLTDVVRRYLEKRFSLRAEHQTTHEFLAELERPDSPLAEQHRRFLKDFLASADMIKFARMSADKTQFEHAAVRAETLVDETAPQEEVSKQGGTRP